MRAGTRNLITLCHNPIQDTPNPCWGKRRPNKRRPNFGVFVAFCNHLMAIPVHKLANIALFQGVDPVTLENISQVMTSRTHLNHDIVIRKGDAGDFLAFLLQGKLQVVNISEDGRETGLHFIQPGSYFGELSVIDGKPRSASVISIRESEVATMPAHQARHLIYNHPLIAQRFLTHFAVILRAASEKQTLLSIPNAFQRVFAQLLLFVRETQQGPVIEGMPKQHEIAIMVNTSRETVSRALHTLLKMNILIKQGQVLVVNRPELLKHAAVSGLPDLGKQGEDAPVAANVPVRQESA